MAHNGVFDRSGRGLIHTLRPFWMSVACGLLLAACTESKDGPADAATAPEPAADAGLAAVQDADGDAGALVAAADLRTTGIFEREGRKVAQAVGFAPKSVDVGLARSRAAHRARANLLTLLKENGLAPKDGQTLRGAAIERTWKEGNRLYALAVLTIENQPGEMNERPPAASNSTGDAPTGTTGQPEGAGK